MEHLCHNMPEDRRLFRSVNEFTDHINPIVIACGRRRRRHLHWWFVLILLVSMGATGMANYLTDPSVTWAGSEAVHVSAVPAVREP